MTNEINNCEPVQADIHLHLKEWKQNPEFAKYKTSQKSFLLKPSLKKPDYSKMTVEQIKEIVTKKEKLLLLTLPDGGKKVRDSIAELQRIITDKQTKPEPEDDVDILVRGMESIRLRKPNPPQHHLPANMKKKPIEMISLVEAKELLNTKIIVKEEQQVEYETDYESEYEFGEETEEQQP
ncbi:hypothetical protein HDV01_000465 [Terramyces sp. JEL0728]|nr:hypothetical protein HDV01_000465 [Terramyces sp. JEL0728]